MREFMLMASGGDTLVLQDFVVKNISKFYAYDF